MRLTVPRLSGLALAVVAASCAHGGNGPAGGKAPAWAAEGRPVGLDTARFLGAVGCAATREGADRKARAELARQFQVEVQAEQVIRERSRIVDGRESRSVSVRDDVRLVARETLTGTTIRERHDDGKTVCSLAVLERQAARDAARAEADRLDGEMARQAGEAERLRDPFAVVRAWKSVAAMAARREELEPVLAVLGGRKGPPPVALDQARQRALSAQEGMRVGIRASGEPARTLVPPLVAALRREGLPVAEGTTADVTVHLELGIAPSVRRGEGIVFLDYTLELAARTAEGSRILATASYSDTVGHRDREAARARILADLQQDTLAGFCRRLRKAWEQALVPESPPAPVEKGRD